MFLNTVEELVEFFGVCGGVFFVFFVCESFVFIWIE